MYILFMFSAGIGRTGVFMLMETALCKMEVLEPIYPLEIVRVMRDQRGMLVQTPVSPQLFITYCTLHRYYTWIAVTPACKIVSTFKTVGKALALVICRNLTYTVSV